MATWILITILVLYIFDRVRTQVESGDGRSCPSDRQWPTTRCSPSSRSSRLFRRWQRVEGCEASGRGRVKRGKLSHDPSKCGYQIAAVPDKKHAIARVGLITLPAIGNADVIGFDRMRAVSGRNTKSRSLPRARLIHYDGARRSGKNRVRGHRNPGRIAPRGSARVQA